MIMLYGLCIYYYSYIQSMKILVFCMLELCSICAQANTARRNVQHHIINHAGYNYMLVIIQHIIMSFSHQNY